MFIDSRRPGALRKAAAFLLGFVLSASLHAQVALSSGSYTQNFDSVSGGLPAGWSVRTGATASSLGSAAAFNTAAVGWASTTGQWANMASADGATGSEATAAQAALADRALAVRQTGAVGDPGAAANFFFATTGLKVTGISFSAQMLSVQPRSATWSLQYGIGAAPAAWTTIATFSDPGAFGSTPVTGAGFGTALDGQAEVWLRVVALTASTGSGNRDSFGIDDFIITTEPVGGGAVAPTITQTPTSQSVAVGATVEFNGAASGTATISYRWRHNSADLGESLRITGTQTPTLRIEDVTSEDAGSYDFVATNSAGEATSAAATLVVNSLTAPSITTEPLPQSVPQGGTAEFKVVAAGSAPLAYQWRKGGSALSASATITGVNTDTLKISPVAAGDAGSYDVVVSNGVNPHATSVAVTLDVTPPVPTASTVTWNFGAASPLGTPSAVAVDVTGGEIGRGNNNGGTTPLLSTTSASSGYSGSTGQHNAGAAAVAGTFNLATSAYFEFTVTPADTRQLSVTGISFGSRSTGTGPKAYTLYSSLDGFATPVATGTFAAVDTTNWGLNNLTLGSLTTGTGIDVTFRLYGHNGSGNPAANTANWRIDDLKVTGTTAEGTPVAPVVQAVVPADGAGGVLPGTALTVTFSRNVAVQPGWFTIVGTGSGAHSAAVTGGAKTFTLTPDVPFVLGESVSLVIDASKVTNLSGTMNLVANHVSSFATISDVPVPIHAVQGSGLTSPFVSQYTTVRGIVVASFQGEGGLGGYYLQAPEAEWDNDPATSEGIYIFDNANPVAVGDLVKVTGLVIEYGTAPHTETELSPVIYFTKEASGQELPPLTAVTLPFPAAGYAERYEGMRVTFPQALTVTDTFSLGQYGELLLSNGRLPQPTNVAAPGAPAQAQLAANLLNQVMLDDGKSPAHPDPTPYLNSANPATATRRAGDTTANVTGVFGNKFGFYVVEPTAPVAFVDANPRPAALPAAGPGLRVAIGNVLNYFNGDGAGGGFPTARGANTLEEYQRQHAKIVAGIVAMAPDIMGLTEIENDRVTNGPASGYGPASAIAQLVNGLNAAAPAGTTYAYVDASAVDIVSDVIHCGFIYRTETVALVGAAKMLDHPSFTGQNIGLARNPLAQTFREIATGEKLTITINHFKSKGSASTDPASTSGLSPNPNLDQGDGQGQSNHVRKLQAQALVNWLATDPTGSGDPDFLIIGDLNAYAKEDPIALIEAAGYINLTEASEGPGGYSYSFDGSFGHLDHALANHALAAQVVEAVTWHVNADEPVFFDYNTEDKSAWHRAINAGTPYRYSDHDPVVVRLALSSPPVAPTIATDPVAQTTTAGTSVTFSVIATGTPPPTYQWRRNGEEIEGANGASFTLGNPKVADSGSYDVVVRNSAGEVISEAVTLTVNPATATVTLSDLTHVYDGNPHAATATTEPAGLNVTIAYSGSATPPKYPGWHPVQATVNSPDYTGSAAGTLFIDVTAFVKRMPLLDGTVRGSVQTATYGAVTINGVIDGDLLVYASAMAKLNGNATYEGTDTGTGAGSIARAVITLNNNARLGRLVQRINPPAFPVIPVPPASAGTRDVTLTAAGQGAGDFATLRNLTLEAGAGAVAVPAGTYGSFATGSGTSLVLGTAGAETPAVYNLQGLALNGGSLVIAGPVVINLAGDAVLNGTAGAASHPEWLDLNLAAGSLTLTGTLVGYVTAPAGTVTINSGSTLTGRVIADRLVINGTGVLDDPEL